MIRIFLQGAFFFLSSIIFQAPSGALATPRDWREYVVPGAKCGNGEPYTIHISSGDPERVVFDFMGGGACWSYGTCQGPIPTTFLGPKHGILENRFGGFVSADPNESPVAGDTMVYLPYCTGDVFVGSHTAQYSKNPVYHWGWKNTVLTFEFLKRYGLLDFKSLKRVVSYGFSAGAIGAIAHIFELERILPKQTERVLLADSPGLHFGDGFWDKFPEPMLQDMEKALGQAGIALDRSSGDLGRHLKTACGMFPSWKIGILQGARDWVMSIIFGNQSPGELAEKIYGAEGIYALARASGGNCAVWAPPISEHVFLWSYASARNVAHEPESKTALEFASEVIRTKTLRNYR